LAHISGGGKKGKPLQILDQGYKTI